MLDDATIRSNSPTGTSILTINTTLSDYILFYCIEDDSCYINCLTSNACNDMIVYCYGNCQVYCDNDTIACPYTGHNTSYQIISTVSTKIKKNNDDDFDWTIFIIALTVCITVCIIVFFAFKYLKKSKQGNETQMAENNAPVSLAK